MRLIRNFVGRLLGAAVEGQAVGPNPRRWALQLSADRNSRKTFSLHGTAVDTQGIVLFVDGHPLTLGYDDFGGAITEEVRVISDAGGVLNLYEIIAEHPIPEHPLRLNRNFIGRSITNNVSAVLAGPSPNRWALLFSGSPTDRYTVDLHNGRELDRGIVMPLNGDGFLMGHRDWG